MHATNEMRPQWSLVLQTLVGSADAWGTELGARIFAQINLQLINLGQGTLIWVDYRGLERSDASFQREAVVETIRKHRPRLLFVAINLSNADLRANLEFALLRRGESLLILEDDGQVTVIGKPLVADQRRILQAVHAAPGFTSTKLLAPPFQLKASTASSQLTALWKAGLIERTEGAAASGGREYSYFPIP
jgi:DNA-binding MarR family transcriptional regulator